jgi:hypothetical protein
MALSFLLKEIFFALLSDIQCCKMQFWIFNYW